MMTVFGNSVEVNWFILLLLPLGKLQQSSLSFEIRILFPITIFDHKKGSRDAIYFNDINSAIFIRNLDTIIDYLVSGN